MLPAKAAPSAISIVPWLVTKAPVKDEKCEYMFLNELLASK